MNTLRYCGAMASVEEYLHTFGISDIATNTSHTGIYARPFSQFYWARPADEA